MAIEPKLDPHGERAADQDALQLHSAHLRLLADRYDQISQAIHWIECSNDMTAGQQLEALEKQRLELLDEIDALVAARRKG